MSHHPLKLLHQYTLSRDENVCVCKPSITQDTMNDFLNRIHLLSRMHGIICIVFNCIHWIRSEVKNFYFFFSWLFVSPLQWNFKRYKMSFTAWVRWTLWHLYKNRKISTLLPPPLLPKSYLYLAKWPCWAPRLRAFIYLLFQSVNLFIASREEVRSLPFCSDSDW